MSEPYVDPDAAVRAQLAEQAAGLQSPAVTQPDLSAATPTSVDVAELLKRFEAMEAAQKAAQDAANPPPPEPDDTLHADGNAPAWLASELAKVERRLAKLEGNA